MNPIYAYRGVLGRPVVAAFHGSTQYVRGFWSIPSLGRNFLSLTGLLKSCQERGWSLWAPQGKGGTWVRGTFCEKWSDPDFVAEVRDSIRMKCGEGPVFVTGFSAGVPPACRLAASLEGVRGLWMYSGFLPRVRIPEDLFSGPTTVSYDVKDIKMISTAARRTVEILRRHGVPVTKIRGGMNRHKWDVRINDEVFDRWADSLIGDVRSGSGAFEGPA